MVPEHLQDGEGELLARVRHLVGKDLPVVTSLDFHANVSPAMIEHASAMIGYRTYPHIDMAETGGHCARLLDRIIAKGHFAKAYRQLPFLIPLTWQCTLADPAARLFRDREELERGEVASLSFTPGFPPADIRICAPSVFAYGESQAAADRAAERLSALVVEAEGDFAGKIWQPDEAVLYAKQRAGRSGKPIVLADTQDNPGAGGNSDTVGLIEALLRNDAQDAAIGILYDPRAAAAAHSAGQGADLEIAIGEGTGISDRKPLAGRFRVERLSDGKFAATGPVYAGNHMNLGPMALLKINGLRIVRVEPEATGGGSGDLPPPGRGAGRAEDPGAEKLGPLPGRFSTDCRRDPGGGSTRPEPGRSPAAALSQSQARYPPDAQGPGI